VPMPDCRSTKHLSDFSQSCQSWEGERRPAYGVGRYEHRIYVEQVRDIVHRASVRYDIIRQLSRIDEEFVLFFERICPSDNWKGPTANTHTHQRRTSDLAAPHSVR
jgi:hypothetical protein